MRIHVFHTGEVHVSPYLPFGGDDCGIIKASGITTPRKDWLWLPVSAYLIEHPMGRILVDTGWHREMSPECVYDRKAQIKSLGSYLLFRINQGRIGIGEAVKVKNADGRFVLLYSDGGYATKSWQKMITSGISQDKRLQRESLKWIRQQNLLPECIESLANHDPEVKPHIVELY